MTRIAFLSSEPIRPRMAGIGIRYLEMARRLPKLSGGEVEVVLVSPATVEEMAEAAAEVPVRSCAAGGFGDLLADCDGAVAQGQLANHLLLECPELPTAIDLYDPWLVENLHYVESLGLDPYKNDHATWVLQMSRGDFFLCSSEEQKTFYCGFLSALGRINPHRMADDPDLAGLIAPVPFGLPDELPPHRPWLPERASGPAPFRILFGGLYDWYDPWVLLAALEGMEADWVLYFIRNPNADSTPQALMSEVEAKCRERGWWGERVRALDWVPAERRWDLLRDVDLLVAPHRPSLETRLSLRTRYLEALAVGCPVIATAGGTIGRLLTEHQAGRVVPPGDANVLRTALEGATRMSEAALEGATRMSEATLEGATRMSEANKINDLETSLAGTTRMSAGATRMSGGATRMLGEPSAEGRRRLVAAFTWPRSLAPLVEFCRRPRRDETKEAFAFRPETVAPADGLPFRLRRRLGRWWRGEGA
ncbi:MAG: glycosyltransferase family 4 protein [Acidobacteriota bacterium]